MTTESKTKLVVIAAFPDLPLLEIAGPGDVFHQASKLINSKTGEKQAYKVLVVAADGSQQVVSRSGITISTPVHFASIEEPVHTLLIAGYHFDRKLPSEKEFYAWVADMHESVTRIGSICVGTFALAKAGILRDKKVTTHWERGPRLHQDFPELHVDTSQFFIRDGKIYTSGGVSSGTDLSLALVEEDYGRDIAVATARHLVLYLKRPGFQSQFSELLPEPELDHGLLTKLHPWIVAHLSEDLSVERLAFQSNMSPRNFARQFLKDAGLTPAKFVEKLRVEMARKLLEESDLSIKQVAQKCGLGNLINMRRVFLRNLMVTPSDYRRSFKSSLEAA
jgi:transcriptional regulator GlxA family with amidase domain